MGTSNHIPDFNGIAADILSRTPRMAATEAVKFFKECFVKQGFTDRSFQRWPARTSPLGGKRLLYGTGALMQSVRERGVTATGVRVGSDAVYAGLHNDGGTIVVTEAMKKYWWARYYEFAGKVRRTGKGRLSQAKGNQTISKKAAFCKAMALRKTGSKVKVPARPFIGHSDALMNSLEGWVIRQIELRCGGD